MRRQEILQQVGQLVQPIAARLGLEVVDVQLAGEGSRHTVLRILMDRPDGGITLDECAQVNEALSRQLDLYDLFPSSYTLEVSSPGLDRPLKTDQDYRRFAGRRAELTTYGPVDGQRRFRGILLGVLGNTIAVRIDGRQVQLPKDQIAQARLVVEFEDLRPDLKA